MPPNGWGAWRGLHTPAEGRQPEEAQEHDPEVEVEVEVEQELEEQEEAGLTSLASAGALPGAPLLRSLFAEAAAT